ARLPRIGSALNALLHDIRDLCAGGADSAGAAAYLSWRIKESQLLGYDLERNYESFRSGWDDSKPVDAVVADLKKRIQDAPAAIKPHYAYALAAYNFRNGDDDAAEFESVIAKYPGHPRAE